MLAFIHIHKTGGTTLQWILRSSLGTRYCEVAPLTIGLAYRQTPWLAPASAADLHYIKQLYPQLEGIGGHHVQPHMDLHDLYPDIQYFTFMRDPLKMRASMYQHGVEALGEENCVLAEWLQEEQSQNRQTKMIAGTADVDKAIKIINDRQIFIGLTDRFNESLLLLKAMAANKLDITYKRMNVSSGDTIAKRALETPQTREMLRSGNEADLELYNYVQQEIYPRYVKEYGTSLSQDLANFEAKLQGFNSRTVSLSFMNKPRLYRLLLLLDLAPYNGRNVTLALMKKYLLYRSKLHLNRRGLKI